MARSQPVFRAIYTCVTHTLILSMLGLHTACSGFSQAEETVTETSTTAAKRTVVALGRLVPKGEVIKLSVPNAEDSRVNQMFVQEGDKVKAGQVIAILQGIEGRQRDLEEAQKSVEYYRAKLEQAKSGDAKQAEIAAQRANIARFEAQLRNETAERQAAIASSEAELRQAQLTYQRNQGLQQQGAVSLENLDQAQQEFETAQAELEQRKAQLDNTLQTLKEQIAQERENLAELQEVRPVDIRVAWTELERALVAVKQKKTELEDTKVRVPVSGQILRINTRVGEQVNTQKGIVELGQTDQMYAIAEVYEKEISKVRLGQRATIVSEYGGFTGEVHGTVERIGLQIGNRNLSEGSDNPKTDENTRVVEVKIRIDPKDSPKVASMTSMQVRVTINLTSKRPL